MMRLILVRHAEATGNAARQFIGSRDDGLTDRGLSQADQLARALEKLRISRIFSSPLRRALKTAETIAQSVKVPAIVDHRLTEQDFGEFEGREIKEFCTTNIAKTATEWRDLDPLESPPNGESLERVQRRVLAFVSSISTDGFVVCVSHVGPIKALLCAAMAVDLRVASQMFLDPASVSVIDWASRPLVRMINGSASLAESGCFRTWC